MFDPHITFYDTILKEGEYNLGASITLADDIGLTLVSGKRVLLNYRLQYLQDKILVLSAETAALVYPVSGNRDGRESLAPVLLKIMEMALADGNKWLRTHHKLGSNPRNISIDDAMHLLMEY